MNTSGAAPASVLSTWLAYIGAFDIPRAHTVLTLPADQAAVRAKALRYAGDVSYLELGDYTGALSYYRRIVSLHPGGKEAHEARGIIGDIYRDRMNDPLAAIAQYADVAASDSPTR